MNDSSVVFRSAEDEYASLASRYRCELKRLVRAGEMSSAEFEDLAYDNKLDSQKFPKLKELLDKVNAAYKTTKRGVAEHKAAAADSPIVAPFVESSDEADPLDEILLTELPKRVGSATAEALAKSMGTDVISFLVSFRRVRTKLIGVRGYETLLNDQLGIEILKDETL